MIYYTAGWSNGYGNARAIRAEDSLVIPPKVEPLDLDEVKKQRRFSATSIDTLFDLWIAAARQHFEEQTGRQLITATWDYVLDGFPAAGAIELPHPPLQDVLSVTYLDGSGAEQTIDSTTYSVIAPSGPYCRRGRVVIAATGSWPTAVASPATVRIRFRAGYGDTPGAVPELIKYALLMLVGHFHKFGEEVAEARNNGTILQLPLGAASVIEAFKYSALPRLVPAGIWTGGVTG